MSTRRVKEIMVSRRPLKQCTLEQNTTYITDIHKGIYNTNFES